MAQPSQVPEDPETAGPSLTTLLVIAVGGALAVGAAFYVRPAPKIESTVQASVVPAATLTVGAAKPAPAPEVAPPAPSLAPDKERLALMMAMAQVKDEKTRTLVRQPGAEAAPPPAAPPAPEVPGARAFAPAPQPEGALAPLAALPPGKPLTDDADAERQKMAETAAKAIRDGDLATARSILEKSMAAGDKTAVLALAETYDPVVLAAMKITQAKPDAQRARALYEQAQKAGEKEARKRLAALKRYERRN